MVAAKGRLNLLEDRMVQDKKMSKQDEVKDFKIYVEAGKVKNYDTAKNGTRRQSVLCKSSSLLNACDSKRETKNLEKAKSKADTYTSSYVGRKVLGDIGNGNRSLSKTEQGKSSRTGNRKSEIMLRPKRVAMDLINREAALSSRESERLDRMQATDGSQTSKRSVVRKNIKVTSDEARNKFQGRSSIAATATGRKSVRNPLHLTRKSFPGPVRKPVNKVETNGKAKKSSGKSDNSKGKQGFPLKPSARSIMPNPSNLSSGPRGNRVSDGFAVMKSVRNPHHLTRKSLPVLKQVSQVGASGTAKESSDKSYNARGKHGFLLKPGARRSILPKTSNSSSRPRGNRVSDGFVTISSRAQTKMDAGVLSRKSLRLAMQTTNTAIKTRRNSKSSLTLATKKHSKPADLLKRNPDEPSVAKNIPSVESQVETAPEEDVSTVTLLRRKSDRRNSFTSSLVSRPKMLEECSKDTFQKTLPNIYDDRNHLEAFDYVDDIYQYYWVMEGQNTLLKNYMDAQKEITPQMRGILINWLIEVHLKFELMEETLFLTVTLLDRYLSVENIKKNEMQLVGLTALLLASKYEDFWHPRVTDLISISAESYTRDQMLKTEKTILKKLKFRLNEPTPYVFMLRFLKAAQSDMKFQRLAFFLIELCLVEYEALNFKPSMLCASAIYVARCTMRLTPSWTPLLVKHARYEESQIRDCAEMILKLHKAAKSGLLKVTYEKYANPEQCRVATIKPLDSLPALTS